MPLLLSISKIERDQETQTAITSLGAETAAWMKYYRETLITTDEGINLSNHIPHHLKSIQHHQLFHHHLHHTYFHNHLPKTFIYVPPINFQPIPTQLSQHHEPRKTHETQKTRLPVTKNQTTSSTLESPWATKNPPTRATNNLTTRTTKNLSTKLVDPSTSKASTCYFQIKETWD